MKVDAISNDTAYYFLRQLGLERTRQRKAMTPQG